MDGDGSWISFIMIAIYMLYSIFGSSGQKKKKPRKKKRAKAAPTREQKTIDEIMEEYLQEIRGEKDRLEGPPPKVEPVPERRNVEPQRERISEAYNQRRDQIIQEKTSDSRIARQAKIDAQKEADQVAIAQMEANENVFSLAEAVARRKGTGLMQRRTKKKKRKKFKFDMGDAILYNVILNRKY